MLARSHLRCKKKATSFLMGKLRTKLERRCARFALHYIPAAAAVRHVSAAEATACSIQSNELPLD